MPDSAPLDGEALRRALLRGDEGVLRQLFDRYWPVLYRQASVLLGPDCDAEDAAAEVWLRVLREARTYRAEGSVFAWLARVCTHVCFDRRRASQRHWKARPGRVRVETTADPRAAATRDQAAARERYLALHRAVEALPEREREAIVLRFFFETSVAEIAVLLRLGLEAARKAIVRGLRRLRTSEGAPALRALLVAGGGES